MPPCPRCAGCQAAAISPVDGLPVCARCYMHDVAPAEHGPCPSRTQP